MSAPMCSNCHARPCWFDSNRNSYSSFCGNTCRQNAQVQQTAYVPHRAQMGEQLCEKAGCSNAAFFDGVKVHLGCTRSHSRQVEEAIRNNTHVPRN